jgi:hypothetical protein
MLFHDLLKSLFGKSKTRRFAGPVHMKGSVEQLEDRLALTVYTWAPLANAGLWSVPGNWLVPNPNPAPIKDPNNPEDLVTATTAPGRQDEVVFRNVVFKGRVPLSTSTDNITGEVVAAMIIQPSYGQNQVTLQKDLQVRSNFRMAGNATIGGSGKLSIGDFPPVGPPAPATFVWTGGTIGEAGKRSQVIIGPGTTGTISGADPKTLNGRTLIIQGIVNWIGDSDITLRGFQGAVSISVEGKFVASPDNAAINDKSEGKSNGNVIQAGGTFEVNTSGTVTLNTPYSTADATGNTTVTTDTLVLTSGPTFADGSGVTLGEKQAAKLSFQGTKAHNLSDVTFSGFFGTVDFASDDITVSGTVTINCDEATMSKGKIKGEKVKINSKLFAWTGGNWENTETEVMMSAKLAIGGAVKLAAKLTNWPQ